jgi:hypothetical protein
MTLLQPVYGPKIEQKVYDYLKMTPTCVETPRSVKCNVICTAGALNVGLDEDNLTIMHGAHNINPYRINPLTPNDL